MNSAYLNLVISSYQMVVMTRMRTHNKSRARRDQRELHRLVVAVAQLISLAPRAPKLQLSTQECQTLDRT